MKLRRESNQTRGVREMDCVSAGRNPKSEGRRPKEIRNPKTEFTGDPKSGPLVAQRPVRLSAFGFRPSGFKAAGSTHRYSPEPARSCTRPSRRNRGYLLTEALVYIGLVFVLLGIGYAAMYRSIDNSVALRRNADDILRAMHAGERWRADIRLATRDVAWDNRGDDPVLRLEGSTNQVNYRFTGSAVYRRTGTGPWSRILEHVGSSLMKRELRPAVIVWRWELELQPQATGSFKPGRVRPLFTFLAVPPSAAMP